MTAFASTEVVVSTDADTGMQMLDNGDMHQLCRGGGGWVANTSTGREGGPGSPLPLVELLLGLLIEVFNKAP